jgi:chitodextrinase
VTIGWSASSDNVGVSGYDLLRNGSTAGTTSATKSTFGSLSCGTSYTFGVDAYDAAGNRSTVSTIVASTSACPDTQPPTTPAGLLVTGATTTSISITWNASFDNVSVAGYDLYQGSSLVGTSSAFTVYTFTGLSCGTSYTLGVDAFDAAANKSTKATVIASTSVCPDTTAPSTPTGLGATSATQTSMTLSWGASTDNVGVTGYGVYRNSVLAGSPTTTGYTLTGLTCGTNYTLAVDAVDAAGNRSGKDSTTAKTSACPDTTAPSTPTGLVITSAGQTSITVGWAASTDNVGVTGYRVFQNGSEVGTSFSTSYVFGGLACGASYTLGVAAVDGAGNISGTASLLATAAACSGSGGGSGGATTANLWVDPSGGSCVRQATPGAYVDSQACSSFNAAYQLAAAGDTIAIQPGTYGNQQILDNPKLAAGSTPVTFCVASGNVTINNSAGYDDNTSNKDRDIGIFGHDLILNGGYCGAPNGWGGSAAHLTTSKNGIATSGANVNENITVENVHTDYFRADAGYSTLQYSQVGPQPASVCASGGPNDLVNAGDLVNDSAQLTHINILFNYIHDGQCVTGAHVDAYQAETDHSLFEGNQVANCSQLYFQSAPASYAQYHMGNQVIDNFFEEYTTPFPGDPYSCDVQAVSSGPPYDFEYNTVSGLVTNTTNAGSHFIANVFLTQGDCGGAQTCDHNVFAPGAGTQGTNAKSCTPKLASGQMWSGSLDSADNPANSDYHLSASDTCANGAGSPTTFPATDINGQTRASPPWAGADQP